MCSEWIVYGAQHSRAQDGWVHYIPKLPESQWTFLALLKALAEEIGDGTPITWPLSDLQKGSVVIAVETGQPEVGERIVHAYASVGIALALEQPIPYSPKVNRCAMALSQVIDGEVTALSFTTDLGSIEVTRPVGAGAQRKKVQAWGSVDGMLETITSHRRLALTTGGDFPCVYIQLSSAETV